MKKIICFSLLALICATSFAQATKKELFSDPEKLGSNFYPYHCVQPVPTPAPEGYEPFFISHFSRHGSRYMDGDEDFVNPLKALKEADSLGMLTGKGKKLLEQVTLAYDAWKGNDGELSELGAREQQGIGHRMAANYPQVFSGAATVEARSTNVHRCLESMRNCTGAIKEDIPTVNMHAVYSPDAMYYAAPGPRSPYRTESSRQIERRAEAVSDSLYRTVDIADKFFRNRDAINDVFKDNPSQFTYHLYMLMRGMQCLPELDLAGKMRKWFTKDELYRLYCADNLAWICGRGFYKGTDPDYLGHFYTVKHMFDVAQDAIDNGTNGADLIFSHDSYLIRLDRAFEFDQAHEIPLDFVNISDYFSTFKTISMAGNIQLVFYRKKGSDDILVKFLLMEGDTHVPVKTDIWPYYHWSDVKAYYMPKIDATIKAFDEAEGKK